MHGLRLALVVPHLLAGGTVEALGVELQIVLVQRHKVAGIAGEGEIVAGVHIAVQADGALASGGVALYYALRRVPVIQKLASK